MKKVQIKIQDAYGIGELNHTFDFDFSATRGSGHTSAEHSQTNIVYARNGTMKTSLAKALNNFSKGIPISDAVHNRTASVEIMDDGSPIDLGKIFVVKSEEEYFETEGMALLLADKVSQDRYADIIAELDAAQEELFELVGRGMGIRGGVEKTLQLFDTDFLGANDNRLATLLSMKSEVESAQDKYKTISYKLITERKVTDFLDKTTTQVILKDYVDIYEKILANSEYFQEGAFDYLNAFDVQKNLDKNNFMDNGVGNWVTLQKKDGSTEEVKSIDELKQKYEADKNRIFETLEKQEQYRKFDDALDKNAELRELQAWVRGHKELVPYLQNYKNSTKKIWQAYMLDNKQSYDNLVLVYESNKEELNELIQKSRDLETEWRNVVEDFKESFRPPFDLKIRNKEDVVLKQEKPNIVMIYSDDRGGVDREIDTDTLYQQVLSKGERRALFILCVMFELRMRSMSGEESLVVFDDIADSFDYKNKYAIIEYLNDLSIDVSNGIHMLLLTHNYDFFRSFRMRCSIHWPTSTKALEANRQRGKITFSGNVPTRIFDHLKNESGRDFNAFVTLVPLTRNIVEYRDGHDDEDYKTLTSVLHVKSDSGSITVNDVIDIIEANIAGLNLSAHRGRTPMQQSILDQAEVIVSTSNDSIEHKIVLSMATRILAEQKIKKHFVDDGKTIDEDSSQTGKWTGEFKLNYPSEHKMQKILHRVNIVTPELLHINAFMYEPIIDMSVDEIVGTYTAIRDV